MQIAERFSKPLQASRILIIQLGDIGDVVWSLPAIRAVRETFPAARVSVLLREGNGTLLAAENSPPQIFEIRKGLGESLRLVRALRRERFDLVFDFRGDERGAYTAFLTGAPVRAAIHLAMPGLRNRLFTHLVAPTGLPLSGVGAADSSLYLLRAFGIEAGSPVPKLRLSEAVRSRASWILADEGIDAAVETSETTVCGDLESSSAATPDLSRLTDSGPDSGGETESVAVSPEKSFGEAPQEDRAEGAIQGRLAPAGDEEPTPVPSASGSLRGGAWVTVNPFSRWPYKEWGADKWARVIDWLWRDFGIATVLVGAPAEQERAAELADGCSGRVHNLAGKTTLAELAGILEQSRLHIGVDSAAPHIAAAVGTPTVTLYGPSDWRYWKPPGDKHRVAVSGMDCVPCHQKGCEGKGVSRCLDSLEVGQVQAVIREALSG